MSQSSDFLYGKIPKRYGIKTTTYLKGLIDALATGDEFISTTVEAVRDNLISVTATGRFLDRAAGRYGIVRGQGSGILDHDFQKLVPLMGMSPKQISDTLLRMIDVFYGPYATHANTTSSAAEPYVLQNNMNLLVRVDDEQIGVVFHTSDFVSIGAATAAEIATAISNKTGGRLIGSIVSDVRTGENFVNIRTKTIGSQGFIQVLGGSSQAKLRFPEMRPLAGTISTWSVGHYLGTDEMTYTITGGPTPAFGAAGVSRGDFVTIRPDSGFNVDNTGTFQVSFVGSGFFRVINPDGFVQSGVTNVHSDDFSFFRPDLGNVLLSSRPAALVETQPRQLTVVIPVTSPVVKRTLKGSHHFHGSVTEVLSTTTNSITVTNTADFVPAGAVRPLTSRLNSRGTVSVVSGTDVTLVNAQNWPDQGSFWVANLRTFFYYQGKLGNTLQNVSPTPPGGLVGSSMVYTERYSYASIIGDTFNGVFPDPSSLAGFEIANAGAKISPNFPGSFLFDRQAKFVAAENLALLQQNVEQGQVTTLVQVDDVSAFSDKGSFVLEFGTGRQEGPIKFFSKVGTMGLMADPSHVYQFDHSSGVGLREVRTLGAYIPRNDGSDLAVYTTSTSPARDLLAKFLRAIAASGVELRFEIRIPDQKWAILPNLYTTDPLDTVLVPPV